MFIAEIATRKLNKVQKCDEGLSKGTQASEATQMNENVIMYKQGWCVPPSLVQMKDRSAGIRTHNPM